VTNGRAILVAVVAAGLTAAVVIGVPRASEHAQSTQFCASCHVMDPYHASVADPASTSLPAIHVQDRLVDRDRACMECHGDYTFLGDAKSKLRGARHLAVQLFGTPPEHLALYVPFPNSNCLRCHAGSRSFEANPMHEAVRADLDTDATRCGDCHQARHDLAAAGPDELP
jgi:cytochrome c-type protein NapC